MLKIAVSIDVTRAASHSMRRLSSSSLTSLVCPHCSILCVASCSAHPAFYAGNEGPVTPSCWPADMVGTHRGPSTWTDGHGHVCFSTTPVIDAGPATIHLRALAAQAAAVS